MDKRFITNEVIATYHQYHYYYMLSVLRKKSYSTYRLMEILGEILLEQFHLRKWEPTYQQYTTYYNQVLAHEKR